MYLNIKIYCFFFHFSSSGEWSWFYKDQGWTGRYDVTFGSSTGTAWVIGTIVGKQRLFRIQNNAMSPWHLSIFLVSFALFILHSAAITDVKLWDVSCGKKWQDEILHRYTSEDKCYLFEILVEIWRYYRQRTVLVKSFIWKREKLQGQY